VPRIAALLEDEWKKELARNGLEGAVNPAASDGAAPGEVACPACGTTAPLVDGACSDCGLTLG
jgi:hypothetical protein